MRYSVLLMLLLILASAGGVLCSQACAAPSAFAADASFESFALAHRPKSVAIADLDGDGEQDVAVANEDGSLTVLFGSWDGTLGSRQDLPVAAWAYSVSVGDLDGDGVPDIVLGGNADFVVMGLGHRAFRAAVQVSPISTYSLALADLNGDGHQDLVIAGIGGGDQLVGILLGAGDGSFGAPAYVPIGASPYDVAVADLTGDGRPDFVTANADAGEISVALNHGNGTFATPTNIPMGGTPRSIALADWDGDGVTDMAVGHATAHTISVLRNRGDGTFLPSVDYASKGSRALCAVDLDGDGHPDLAASDAYEKVVTLLNQGDGTFMADRAFPGGNDPVAIAAGFFDGDDHVDLVVASYFAPALSVFHGNGDGTLGLAHQFAIASGPFLGQGSIAMATRDLNRDGANDLIITNPHFGTLAVLFSDGQGGLSARTDYYAGQSQSGVTTGDFNEDGELDVAVGNGGYRKVSILPGAGSGALGSLYEVRIRQAVTALACGDLNGDGHLDLVTIGGADSSSVCVTYGHGDGTFGSSYLIPPGAFAYPIPTAVAVEDMNRDGFLDIVVVRSNANRVSIVPGHGDGTFGPPADYLVDPGPLWNAIGDLNGDGWPDLAVVCDGTNAVLVLMNNGDGTLGAATSYGMGAGLAGAAIGDLDRDGFPDVAVASTNYSWIAILFGRGDGSFSNKRYFGAGYYPENILMLDLNLDGKPDLVAARQSVATVLLNRTVEVPTAVLASLASFRAEPDLVALVWLASESNASRGTVYRRSGHEPWSFVGEAHANGRGEYLYDDRRVVAGASYIYRLGLVVDGTEIFTAESRVDVPKRLELSIAAIGSNPSMQGIAVRFTLPSASPARLDVLDVSGRRIVSRELGALSAGAHTLDLFRPGAVASGLYMIRIQQGSRAVMTKATVIR